MSGRPDSFMPLYIGDYLADTTHLTRDQHGAYLLLLMAYWKRGEPLLADDARLASTAKATASEWRRIRPVMLEMFREDGDVWRHKRLDAELEKAGIKYAARKAASDAGVAARSVKRPVIPKVEPKVRPSVEPLVNQPQPQPQPQSPTGEKTYAVASRPHPVDASPEFIRFPTNRFESMGEEVTFTEKFVEDFQGLYQAVDVRSELRAACAWCVANPNLRKTKKGMSRFINAWLSRQQNKGVPRETGYRNGQGKRSAHDNFNAGIALFIAGNREDDEQSGEGPPGPDADAARLPLLAP